MESNVTKKNAMLKVCEFLWVHRLTMKSMGAKPSKPVV
jgi:hypothetical protein